MIKKTLTETIKELEDELKDVKNLYDSHCVNWKGKTSDSDEYYTEIIARELLKPEKLVLLKKIGQIDRNCYDVKTHDGQHKGDTNRAEEIFAIRLKGKKLDKLGVVVEYQVPLKKKRSDNAGKIDLVTSTGTFIYVIELKYIGNKETLLRTTLEIWTYYKQLNKVNFLNSFGMLKKNKSEDIKKAVLLKAGCYAYKEAKEFRSGSALERLTKALGVKIFLSDEKERVIEVK